MSKEQSAATGIAVLWISGLLIASPAAAQITLDGSTGPVVSLEGTKVEIPAWLGRREGGNLFHSFGTFSILEGGSATFTGPAGIDNVISRVTGGQVSTIDGELASTILGADFFFLNPAGVIFGPNATLNVKGSFHVSTADELRFTDGQVFSATNPVAGSFTMAAPEAFGFLGADAGPITVRGSELLGAGGETFSLIGGDISIITDEDSGFAGFIGIAGDPPPRGDVALVAMNRAGTVAVPDGTPSAPAAGTIRIEESFVDVSGETEGGGAIRVFAGDFIIDGGAIASNNVDGPQSGGIQITSGRVSVVGRVGVRDLGAIFSNTFGAGPAGDIVLRVRELEVTNDGGIRSDTGGAGRAGDITIVGADRVLVSGDPRFLGKPRGENDPRTEISSEVGDLPDATGRAGDIRIDSNVIVVRNSGSITSSSQGPGDAGTMTVVADRIHLETGGQISSATIQTEHSSGAGGVVSVTARQELVISGEGQHSPITMDPEPSGIFASVESLVASGPGGSVSVTAPVIRLADRGEISSETENPQRGGTVNVTFVDLLEVDNAEITTKANFGDAGDINISGSGLINLKNGGQISTTVDRGDGEAGGIAVSSRLIVLNAGIIRANGVENRGGNIRIAAEEALVRTHDSVIQALSELGVDGTVSIDAPGEDVLQSLDALPIAFVDVSSLLAEDCAARAARGASRGGSLVGGGRGGVPTSPEAPLAATYSDTLRTPSGLVNEAEIDRAFSTCVD